MGVLLVLSRAPFDNLFYKAAYRMCVKNTGMIIYEYKNSGLKSGPEFFLISGIDIADMVC